MLGILEKEKCPASAQILARPERGEHLRGCRKGKPAGCRRVSQRPSVSAGMRCPPPITPLSAGWLQGWPGSARPRHPGGLAHPHWQCVDWQLGTELASPHPGAVTQAVRLPLCLACRLVPCWTSPQLFLPFFPSQGPDSGLSSFSPTPALEAVVTEVELDAPKKKKNESWSPQC